MHFLQDKGINIRIICQHASVPTTTQTLSITKQKKQAWGRNDLVLQKEPPSLPRFLLVASGRRDCPQAHSRCASSWTTPPWGISFFRLIEYIKTS